MNIVCDTNVLVSGLINPFGPPGEIIRMVISTKFNLIYDARIISEYQRVLSYPKFKFNAKQIDNLLEQIQANGLLITPTPLKNKLPHPSDSVFLEAAFATKVKYLITGNLKHFPKSHTENIEAISPAQFIELIRSAFDK